jgi:hypothetical protein
MYKQQDRDLAGRSHDTPGSNPIRAPYFEETCMTESTKEATLEISVLSPKYVHVSLRSKWAAGKAM